MINYFKKLLYIFILFLIINFIFYSNNVYAENVSIGDMGFVWDNSITDTPSNTYTLANNQSLKEPLVIINYVGESKPFTYIIMNWCTTNYYMIQDMFITNNAYVDSYINDGKGASYVQELGSCQINGYNGTVVVKQFEIGKYEDLDGTGWELGASGYMNFKNTIGYNALYRLDSIYLSSNDYVTSLSLEQNAILEQKKTNQNLNNIDNSINNLDNSINNSSVDNPSGKFNEFDNFLPDNGVITQLLTLPISLFQKVLNSINGSCNEYNLGNLFGTNLKLPCINIPNYIGATIWNVIDILFSGFFVITISKKMIKTFNSFSSMEEGDVLD